jgi:molecular chaperone Hsp33
MSEDIISKIICDKLNLRAYTVNSLNTAKTITKNHKTTPNATSALSKTITATALLSATLKPDSDQSLSLKFLGEGPIKDVTVQADAKGNIRGFTGNPNVDITDDIGTISFSKSIGAGIIQIEKNLGITTEPYNSITPMYRGEVATELAYYLTISEQIPSAVIIGLNMDKKGEITSSGGILILTFPDTRDDVIEKVEHNINSMEETLSNLMEKGTDINKVVKDIFDDNEIDIIETYSMREKCRCNKEMLYSVLKNISKEEIEDMIEKDKGAEIKCTFCTKVYNFDKNDLLKIIKTTH